MSYWASSLVMFTKHPFHGSWSDMRKRFPNCLDLVDCFRVYVFLSHFMIGLSPSIRDGKISREEMIDYFMKASSLLNCKMGFIHTFMETTYVKPTFCEHCTGFVSIRCSCNHIEIDSCFFGYPYELPLWYYPSCSV